MGNSSSHAFPCKYPNCSRPRIFVPWSKWCEHHICPICKELTNTPGMQPKEIKSFECKVHRCQINRCHEERVGNKLYCELHICHYEDCNDRITTNPESNYCKKHICKTCAKNHSDFSSEIESINCSKHRCTFGTCYRKKYRKKPFCEIHTCPIKGCAIGKLPQHYTCDSHDGEVNLKIQVRQAEEKYYQFLLKLERCPNCHGKIFSPIDNYPYVHLCPKNCLLDDNDMMKYYFTSPNLLPPAGWIIDYDPDHPPDYLKDDYDLDEVMPFVRASNKNKTRSMPPLYQINQFLHQIDS